MTLLDGLYIVPDTGPHGEAVTKIGLARDLKQRFARMTDRLTPIKPIAAWRSQRLCRSAGGLAEMACVYRG